MTKVTMKAVDSLHVSSATPNFAEAGRKFEVNEAEAKELEARGLATRVGGSKAAPAPENKMDAAPANKGLISGDVVKAPTARKGK